MTKPKQTKQPIQYIGPNNYFSKEKPLCLEDKSFYHETRTEFKCNKRYFERDIKQALAQLRIYLKANEIKDEIDTKIFVAKAVYEILDEVFGKSLMPSSISSDTEKECEGK